MNEVQRMLLEQKRKLLQIQLILQDWLKGWLPIFWTIRKSADKRQFEYFECSTKEDKKLWLQVLEQPILKGLPIPSSAIKITTGYPVQSEMQRLYPSALTLPYMPSLPFGNPLERDFKKVLPLAASTLNIVDKEEVYFFLTKYPPVIRLPFNTIYKLEEATVMAPENLCIMSNTYDWLIFRSLEHEWFWGYRDKKLDL
jgi:hypothetical protein